MEASIIIEADEELDLVCKLLFYQPTGYYSNAQSLYRDLKKEGYHFPVKKIEEWLHNQSTWQIYSPSPKYISRVSYGKISKPNCVHMCDLLFLTHDHYKGKKWIAVLNIIDVSSRYKASVPLISKKSREVANAFIKRAPSLAILSIFGVFI